MGSKSRCYNDKEDTKTFMKSYIEDMTRHFTRCLNCWLANLGANQHKGVVIVHLTMRIINMRKLFSQILDLKINPMNWRIRSDVQLLIFPFLKRALTPLMTWRKQQIISINLVENLGNLFLSIQFHRSSHQIKQGGSGNMKPSLNQEFKYTIGKLIIPSFEHSSQMSTNSWIQLSVYFQLNLMVEEDALKISFYILKQKPIIGGSMLLDLSDIIRFILRGFLQCLHREIWKEIPWTSFQIITTIKASLDP